MEEFLFQNGCKCPQLQNQILLVDDDEDDQSIFLAIVEKIRPALKCATAWNGIDALNIISASDPLPEMIFLDLNMPLMNGHQFLTEITKDTRLRNIPVIVLSTSSHLPTREKALLELGAWHFFTKPSSMSDWEEQLRPVLTARRGMYNSETVSQKWMM